MVQSLVLKDGKLLLRPDKLAMSDGNDCECCEPACGAVATAGEGMLDVRNYVMPARAGAVQFSYRSYSIPDTFKVEGGGVVFINTGPVSTGQQPVNASFFKPLGLTKVTVTVTSAEPYTAWNYSIGCPDSPCPCGAQVMLTGALGFTVDIIYAGGTASYCTANPTAGNVITPGFTSPGFYDPATYPSGAASQRYAACDTYTRAGEYRIDTVIDTGRNLKLYFTSNCTSLPTITGWEDSGSGVAGVSQIVNIVIGGAC